jgi:hypothetical protein
MESESYREQFLEDMAAWLRQECQPFPAPPPAESQEFSPQDAAWLKRLGISLSREGGRGSASGQIRTTGV